jgi:general secretion pathway protein K
MPLIVFCRDTTSIRPNERGFALLLVLWSMSLLSLLATQITMAGHGEARIALSLRGQAQLQAAADAAVQEAIWHLLPGPNDVWTPDQPDYVLQEGPYTVSVHIIDDRGKLDVNFMSADVLTSLFVVLGSDRQTANSLGTAIYAWRGGQLPENTVAPGPAPGAIWGAPNQPFQRLDGLLIVPGMTRQLYDLAVPHLILAMDQGPLRRVADPVVTATLDLNKREHKVSEADFDPARPMVVGIVARTESQGAVFVRRATVRITSGPDSGNAYYRVLDWSDGADKPDS